MDSIMIVFVETIAEGRFSIKVNTSDTVLTIKKKLAKYHRIPVFKQTLYLDSKVLDDNLVIEQCKIFNNSRLFLDISPNSNPNDPTETLYSRVKAFRDIYKIERFGLEKSDICKLIQDQVLLQTETESSSTSGINIQDSSVKVTSNSKKRKSLPLNVLPFQDPKKVPVKVNSDDKVEKLREKLDVLNHFRMFTLPGREYIFINKQHVLIDDQTFEENGVASFDTLEILGTKFPVRGNRSNKNVSLRLNSSQQLRATQDLPPVSAGNKGIKTKQSPNPVSVKRGIISTPDSPDSPERMEFTVMVQPFKEETRRILVRFDLPEEGYFFIHQQYVLADHHTFEENHVLYQIWLLIHKTIPYCYIFQS